MTDPASEGTSVLTLDPERPWPGLESFSERLSGYFHGRSDELEDLFRRVRRRPLTVLYGQSGLGKTSLLQAGLFPRLRREGFLPVPIRLDFGEVDPPRRMRDAEPPGRQIAAALAKAVASAGLLEASDPLAAAGIWEYLHDVRFRLPDATGSPLVPVFVFDQFEELFTFGRTRRDFPTFHDACVRTLADLIENRPPGELEALARSRPEAVDRYDFARQDYRMLIGIREDYLPHLHGLKREIPSISLNNIRLTRMTGDQALEAVEGPGGALVTRRVAVAIVQSVAGKDVRGEGSALTGEQAVSASVDQSLDLASLDIEPSFLSLFCQRVNNRRIARGDRTITLELVAASRESVLSDFYDECFEGLGDGVRAFVENELLTDTGYRDRLEEGRARRLLQQQYGSPEEALRLLVQRRLLHREEGGPTPQIELTHDVLAPIVLKRREERRQLAAIDSAKRREEELRKEAEARKAAAELELGRARRQQRQTLGLLGLALLAAVAAVGFGIRASNATRLANQTVQELQRNQKALQDTTDAARNARRDADANKRKAVDALDVSQKALLAEREAVANSQAMLADFCSYGLKVINRFGDSTSGNRGLSSAFSSLIAISDTSVEAMKSRNPGDPCPRILDARIESVASGIALDLGDTAQARWRAIRGLAAARTLRRFQDSSLARRALNEAYFSLAYNFFFAKDYANSLAAAQEGLPYARTVDFTRDSTGVDRVARIYHYGALSLLELKRPRESRAWVDSGLAFVARGRQRGDQKAADLQFTESQLYLRLAEASVDPVLHDTAAALAATDAAVRVARTRHQARRLVGTREWLARMHARRGIYARQWGRYAEATAANDSALDNWSSIVRQGRSDPDTVMIVDGLEGVINALTEQASARGGLRQWGASLAASRAAIDSALVLDRLRATADHHRLLREAWHQLAHRAQDAGQLTLADSAIGRAIIADTVLIAREFGSVVQAEGELEDHIADGTRILNARVLADTAGRDSVTIVGVLRRYEESRKLRREILVWNRRRILARLGAPARDTLGSELGNLSWSYLLVDQPERAVQAAREGMTLSPGQTFILPNYLNALVLMGRDEEAAAFFRQHADEMVESTPILFACAVARDIHALVARGVATARHVEVVEGLAASRRERCPKTPATR